MTSCKSVMKVAIIGASGLTGKSLAMCLKQSPLIDEVAIFDHRPIRGLLQELSHTSRCKTIQHSKNYTGSSNHDLELTLRNAGIVAITSTHQRISDEANALHQLVPKIAKFCPKAFVAVASRSVNVLVPMLYELLKKTCVFDGNRLFGVLNLFSMRANYFASQSLGIAPEYITTPVIGGGCSKTCVPLFSQSKPCSDFTPDELSKLIVAVRSAEEQLGRSYKDTNVDSSESFAMSLGFAAARFCISLCKAIRDEPGIEECAYVRSCLMPDVKYFGERLVLGPSGIQKRLGVPKLTNQECSALYDAIPEIKKKIKLGEVLALGDATSTEICPQPPTCSALQVYKPAKCSCKVG